MEERLGSSSVSIRLEGFSITIADGNIAIELTRMESLARKKPEVETDLGFPGSASGAVPKVEELVAAFKAYALSETARPLTTLRSIENRGHHNVPC